jgi:hypothetical protein
MNIDNVVPASDSEAVVGLASAAALSTPVVKTLASTAAEVLVSPAVAAVGSGASNAKVAISFVTRSSDRLLITLSGRIVESMTGNAAYPAPFPTLAVVTATRGAYVSAVNGLSRGAQAIAQRNQTRAALAQALRDLALYVQHASQGDRVKLIGSGFPVQARRTRGSVGLLPPPANVRLRRTRNSNQMVALCDAVPAARSYQWRYATAQAPTAWTQPDPITTARFTLDNVVPGTVYIVQVRVFGTAGPSDWSDVATLMAA